MSCHEENLKIIFGSVERSKCLAEWLHDLEDFREPVVYSQRLGLIP